MALLNIYQTEPRQPVKNFNDKLELAHKTNSLNFLMIMSIQGVIIVHIITKLLGSTQNAELKQCDK